MVEVIFMIDKEGNTFEPMVDVSSKSVFEKPALLSVKNFRYEPATLNGNPIESVKRTRVLFLVKNQDDQVSKSFYKSYKSALKELKKEDSNKLKVQGKIKSMENSQHMSPYSYRHLNSVKHAYAEKFDTKQAQIDAIYQLLLFEGHSQDSKAILDNKTRVIFRRNLVALLIQTAQYGSAKDEYRTLKSIDPDANTIFKTPFKQINDIYKSDQPVQTQIHLNSQGYNSIRLFKNKFGFIEGSNVSQLKLRCTKKFKILEYKPESEYNIPKSWGECYLQTIGKPDSSAQLYQL